MASRRGHHLCEAQHEVLLPGVEGQRLRPLQRNQVLGPLLQQAHVLLQAEDGIPRRQCQDTLKNGLFIGRTMSECDL